MTKEKYEIRLAEVLKREMEKGGWSIEALSHVSGVPPSTLGEWRNGRVPKNPLQTIAVAEVLKIEFKTLYFGSHLLD